MMKASSFFMIMFFLLYFLYIIFANYCFDRVLLYFFSFSDTFFNFSVISFRQIFFISLIFFIPNFALVFRNDTNLSLSLSIQCFFLFIYFSQTVCVFYLLSLFLHILKGVGCIFYINITY